MARSSQTPKSCTFLSAFCAFFALGPYGKEFDTTWHYLLVFPDFLFFPVLLLLQKPRITISSYRSWGWLPLSYFSPQDV